jgi:DNA (cytosine-5)-methyltransferase 1
MSARIPRENPVPTAHSRDPLEQARQRFTQQGEGPRPRRLMPREYARLMGFPDTFRIPVSDTQAYRQFGNRVAMPVMREVARTMMPHLDAVLASGATQAAPKAQAKSGAARKTSAARKATAAARETPRTGPAAEAA